MREERVSDNARGLISTITNVQHLVLRIDIGLDSYQPVHRPSLALLRRPVEGGPSALPRVAHAGGRAGGRTGDPHYSSSNRPNACVGAQAWVHPLRLYWPSRGARFDILVGSIQISISTVPASEIRTYGRPDLLRGPTLVIRQERGVAAIAIQGRLRVSVRRMRFVCAIFELTDPIALPPQEGKSGGSGGKTDDEPADEGRTLCSVAIRRG